MGYGEQATARGTNRVSVPSGRDQGDRALPRLESFRAGVKAGTPYSIAVLLVAVSFGVLAEPVIGATAAMVMSIFVFAGSAQFGATAVLASIPAGLLLIFAQRYIAAGAVSGAVK